MDLDKNDITGLNENDKYELWDLLEDSTNKQNDNLFKVTTCNCRKPTITEKNTKIKKLLTAIADLLDVN